MLSTEETEKEYDTLRTACDEAIGETAQGVLDGAVPFCQLVSLCETACRLFRCEGDPLVCCGSLSGPASFFTQKFTLMLLKALGIPTIDMGLCAEHEAFINGVLQHDAEYIICTAFTETEACMINEIHKRACELGIRDRFQLLLGGVVPKTVLPIDNNDQRTIAVVLNVAAEMKKKAVKQKNQE